MKTISPQADEEEIFEFCQEWIDSLVRQDYQAASALLYDGLNPWSADEIRDAIRTCGTMDTAWGTADTFRVTSFEDAVGENPRNFEHEDFEVPPMRRVLHPHWPIEIVWIDPKLISSEIIGSVNLDYAINGEWSDLSSNFDLVRVDDRVAFSLGRIDVF